ncbi:MAG: class I SAM-dependent methyltransferase [Thermoplasmata archaeon]|nr:class I SAM-dependent methyltransferase [Thermoplasmata archaeon]
MALPRRSMKWPPPPPGRPEWAWLLQLPPRGWMLRQLLRPAALSLPDGALVVSVGGGPGYEFEQLDRLRPPGQRWRFVLLDAQGAMLDHAKARAARRPQFVAPALSRGDAVALPFRSGAVDVVVSLGVLCCMTEPGVDLAVEETWRAVCPGGFVVLSVPRWRGAADEARHLRTGFVRRAGWRPGRAVFQKPL